MERFGVALACGAALGLLLTLKLAWQVATTGVFLDPDDAMRAVELRDFMAGQAWFDLVPHRLSPDHPFVMHWSRLVDLPLAVLTWSFGLVLSPAAAELAMRLVAPGLLALAAIALVIALVRDLIGPRAMLPAALLFTGCGEIVSQFIPGHIHHHGAQAMLLLGATKLLLDALRPAAGWRPAAGAGVLAALSLGIGLQNLPFVVGLAACVAAAWVVRGGPAVPGLVGFCTGLAVAAVAVFALDVAPAVYGEGACDAFSTAHLLAAGSGGLVGMLLAGVSPWLRALPHRALAAAAGAVAVLGLLHAIYPACLHDPMAGIDPVLRDKWLADVGEALPLRRLIAGDVPAGLALALTLACGLAATGAALLGAEAARRPAWAALLLLGVIGVMGTLYQVRVAGAACGCLVPGVAWSALALYDKAVRRPGSPALLLAVLVGLCGNGAAWTALAVPMERMVPTRSTPSGGSDPAACFDPRAYGPLAALPPGLVLSTIDPGSTILASTPHSVLAAPYHRNSFGNRIALLTFEATPEAARPLMREGRATYLALCRASPEAADTAARHPESLAAALLSGRTPAWLIPLGPADAPILLFRVAA